MGKARLIGPAIVVPGLGSGMHDRGRENAKTKLAGTRPAATVFQLRVRRWYDFGRVTER